MSIILNLYYTGENGNADKFVEDMIGLGIVDSIKQEPGNIRYEFFFSSNDPETVLLIDEWENQEALDNHHKSPMMEQIIKLREKYDLHMRVERLSPIDTNTQDDKYIRK